MKYWIYSSSGMPNTCGGYLSSLPAEAERFAEAVRGHWGVEDAVHWVLDVQMNEDRCRVCDRAAAQNLATGLLLEPAAARPATQSRRARQAKAAGWSPQYRLSLLKF